MWIVLSKSWLTGEVSDDNAGQGKGQVEDPDTLVHATWLEFHVKWKGYPLAQEEGWVKQKHLGCPDLVGRALTLVSSSLLQESQTLLYLGASSQLPAHTVPPLRRM